MKITVTGDKKHVETLIRENKIKVSRGLLKFETEKPKKEPVTPKKTEDKEK
jgi:hypothetical protein